MMHQRSLPAAIAAALMAAPAAADELDPVVVGADPLGQTTGEIAGSVSVVDAAEIEDRGAGHFGDLLFDLPNLNFSGQSSRPRHLQVRGIGELDQYTGKPNPSVGFTVDGVDFSGIGMVGGLFDAEQVEVLRGPQGFRFGDSALAGLVNIETRDPTPYPEAWGEVSTGTDGLVELGAVSSGPLDAQGRVQYRIAAQAHREDGFRENVYLDREATDGRDEALLRGKLRWQPHAGLTADLTLTHNDLDNGYDAWSLDNSFTTRSDEPGRDTQLSNAASLALDWSAPEHYRLVSETAFADSDMEYAYDGDWANPDYWERDYPGQPYRFHYQNLKDRQMASQELRLHSTPSSRLFGGRTDWVVGAFAQRLDEENRTFTEGEDAFFGAYATRADTDYRADNLALFGQLDHALRPATRLTAGLRVERRDTAFTSGQGESFSPADTSVGGQLALGHDLSETQRVHALVSRGYKAAGFNAALPADSPESLRRFDEESLWNYELGWRGRWPEKGLSAGANLFYMDRSDAQFNGYTYVGTHYVFFTENFDSASNYGLEADLDWAVSDRWRLFGNLGLLETEVSGESEIFTVADREQAHAPNYQLSAGLQYRDGDGWFARLEGRAMDAFYFDNVHDQRSDAYEVFNARLGFEAADWEAYLWGQNLFDREYATRGFYFANDPEYADTRRFIHLGDPRRVGVTARFYFQ